MSNDLLSVLTREGVLIDVSVRYWRAHKKLKAEDLGLDPDTVTNHLISLGHKKLLPTQALAAFALVESRAHALVEASTFPFMGRIGHFLPNKKLAEVTNRLDSLKGEFEDARRSFLDQYSSLRMDAAREWWEAARRLVSDPDRLVATIENSFPDASRMDRYFEFDVSLFQIRAPEALQTELITLGDQQSIIEARARAAREAAERIRAGSEGFVADCVATLRQETAQLVDGMIESMSSGKTGTVHQKTLNRLARFIDQFKELNFAGDQELENQLERARKEILSHTAEEYRDDVFAEERLRTGLKRLGTKARELAKADAREVVERFGQMGVRKFHLAA